jgi:deoxyribonuclease-4
MEGSFSSSKEPLIGAHTSTAGGLHCALLAGQEIGATTVQIFTSNQKQWQGRQLSSEDLRLWERTLEETHIRNVMSHDSYLINLGSCRQDLLEKSRAAFAEELQRCHSLNLTYLNFHPGAATQGTKEDCLTTIVESLLSLEPLILQGNTLLLLETTAGQGTSIGSRFEEIGYILQQCLSRIPLGVCLDTCHVFAAGYDLRTPKAFDHTLKLFDQAIGLPHLKAFHCNDSQKGLGSHVDRHANLGEGLLGFDTFHILSQHKVTAPLPKYLETPDGPARWKEEIRWLKQAHLTPL